MGDGNFHPAVLTDNRNKEHYERALKCVDEIIEIALNLGGVPFRRARHRAGKAAFPEKSHGPGSNRDDEKIKALIDPKNTLNPGKIWEE